MADTSKDLAHLLNQNLGRVQTLLADYHGPLSDVVALVLDLRDERADRFCRLVLASHNGLSEAEVEAEVRRLRSPAAVGLIPVAVLQTSWAAARHLLPTTSDDALETIKRLHRDVPAGHFLVVAVGTGDNLYGWVEKTT